MISVPRGVEERGYLPGAAESAAVFVLCTAAGLVAFWPQLTHAAFYRDDWGFAQFYLGHPHDFWTAALHETLRINRPVYWAYENLVFGLFGLRQAPQEILAFLLSAIFSTLTFVFLRLVRLGRGPSLFVAVLLMIFPVSNSTRLLPSTGTITLGVIFFLAGATTALAMLRSGERSPGGDVVARVFYAISLLAYQSATAFILLTCLIYRLVVPWNIALRRWRGDLLYVGSFYVAFTVANSLFGEQQIATAPMSTWAHHAARIAGEAAAILGLTVVPSGSVLTGSIAIERAVLIVVVFFLVVGLSLRLVRHGAHGEREQTARYWLRVIGISIVAIGLAYIVYVPADYAQYHPLARGQGNRINQVAAVPMLLIVYALLMLAINLVRARLPGLVRRAHAALPAILGLALLAAYLVTERDDITRWQAAAANQRVMVATLRSALPRNRSPITVAVFGPLDLVNADVPQSTNDLVFDLQGMFAVPLRRLGVRAYLIGAATPVECRARTVVPLGNRSFASPYGATAFLFPLTHKYALIPDQATCLRLAPQARTQLK